MLRLAVVLLALAASHGALAQGAAAESDRRERAAAIAGLTDPKPLRRIEAIVWFAQNGSPADDEHLLPRLADDEPFVRTLAERAVWTMWSRSGDAAVDALMERGAEETAAGRYDTAIATYSEVIRRRPAFAEGWNKRATVYFLAGDFTRSLADCDQVMKRNPHHFGALSGYGQIYFHLQRYDKAIESWRRALDLNPNLEGLETGIEAAERLRAQARKGTVRLEPPLAPRAVGVASLRNVLYA
jgi:tetratricopeptide (TPR) repeat protein